MKVKELLEKLKQLPPDDMILIEGYEGGLSDPLPLKSVRVKLDIHPESYYGPHDEADDGEINAHVLYRKTRLV